MQEAKDAMEKGSDNDAVNELLSSSQAPNVSANKEILLSNIATQATTVLEKDTQENVEVKVDDDGEDDEEDSDEKSSDNDDESSTLRTKSYAK
jgi:hypothetical protein